ncbi:hypothetical protein DPMN_123750 [Dreissena polymorpha]|uniref:Uncharacterized protein n=1 Tax=Dreissena polymorpha TaxID=45954 RepID=A0A9D4GV22_DREPO|nr:hypothetical protein DPMN_123750 [Dreissena polymorpha]
MMCTRASDNKQRTRDYNNSRNVRKKTRLRVMNESLSALGNITNVYHREIGPRRLEKKAFANSVDPDETPHDAASHLGLRCCGVSSGSALYA